MLAFEQLNGSHTGINLASVVFDILQEYDIMEKFFCMTTDSASNNGTMVRQLERLLEEEGIPWNHEVHHIRCLAHVINLVVGAFLKNLVDGDGISFKTVLLKIRSLAKALRRSTLLWEAFVEICKYYHINPMTIPVDVAPRWDSAYGMLEIVIYLRKAIHRLVDDYSKELGEYRLTDYEWE